MSIVDMVHKVFGKRMKRTDALFSWHMKDLKDFTVNELHDLRKTCVYFKDDNPKMSSTVMKRIGTELATRVIGKPKVTITKNKGKKNARRTKSNRNRPSTNQQETTKCVRNIPIK